MGRDTNILVMDEPAANLDPDARHIFFELLAERLENTTMLISSHRLDEVAPWSTACWKWTAARWCWMTGWRTTLRFPASWLAA